MAKSLGFSEAIEVFKRVWSGQTVKMACGNCPTKKRALYQFCEDHGVEPPKKCTPKAKPIKKEQLTNEALTDVVREGCFRHAADDSSWAKTTLSLLELESKSKTGNVTASEYHEFIKDLFLPHVATCPNCSTKIDTRDGKEYNIAAVKREA